MGLAHPPGDFTDAENAAFIAAVRALTPQQLLTLLVFLALRSEPNRTAILAKIP